MTSKLQEITQAVAAKRAHELAVMTDAETHRNQLAEAQYQGLRRWNSDILPALQNSVEAINDALRRGCEGTYLKGQSRREHLIVRGQVERGELMAVTLRLVLNGRLRTAISFALDAADLPDAAVLAITADNRNVVRLVLDESFQADSVGVWLQRIVHKATTATAA